jgi:SAM-dependent methyltransferase
MRLARSLKNRRILPELMDQPGLDEAEHHQALAALARINRVSGTAGVLWPLIREACKRRRSQNGSAVRLLDIATGGGDLPVSLWKRARRAGLDLEAAGCDRSPQAVARAQALARRERAEVAFFVHDAVADPLPPGYDILVSSLFLHHLEEPQALDFLRALGSTGGMVLVDDLRRSAAGWLLAYLGVRLLSRSRIARVDGPRSVQAAFTCNEALALACRAGWTTPEVRRHWPCRFLLIRRST